MSSVVAMVCYCVSQTLAQFLQKNIAGVEKCCKMSECNIFVKPLQKYLKCTGKHSVKVQICIDTENKTLQSRELDGK